MSTRTRLIVLFASVPVIAFTLVGGFLGRVAAGEDAYRHLRIFEDVVSLISNNYVEDVDLDDVMNGALRGLTEGLDAVAVPKLEKVEEVLKVDAWLELFEHKAGLPIGSIEIMVLPETARGIMDAYKLATACPRVGNLIGGVGARSGDVTKAIGYKWTRQGLETLYLASHILLAARAAGIEYPIGGGSLEVGDIELVRSQIQRGREVGFRGCLLIHPSAVPIANEIFSPSPEEIEWNKGIMQAMADAEKAGKAAVTYDGMMIDYAHVRNALELLQQAESFGIEVGEYADVKAL